MELTPENVLAVMKEHFANVSDEDFATGVGAAAGKSRTLMRRQLTAECQLGQDPLVGGDLSGKEVGSHTSVAQFDAPSEADQVG